MTATAFADKAAWERAEIERSAFEASHTPDEQLRADPRQVARYMQPSPTTVYPLEYAYALLGDVRGLRVLDFGCGSGENSLLLARRGARVVGVDISASLIDLAKRRLRVNHAERGAAFIVGSAHDLPIHAASVDVVLGIAILHHLDLDASAREVHRVLKSGGRAIFQEPVRQSAVLRAVRRVIPYRAPDVSPYERPLTDGEISRFADRFSSRRVRTFSLPFVNLAWAVPPFRKYIHDAYRLDGALLKRVPSLAAYAGIEVIELVK
jgi:ubiquinone/menaquinone biosynthesis C-methylase UbiE